MIISVSGGSGFIGRNLYEAMSNLDKSNRIKILDLKEPKFKLRSGDVFIKGDIRNSKLAKELVKDSQILIHLAASHADHGIEQSEYYDVNVKGTQVLLEACLEHKVEKIVFTSSVAVYGKSYADDNTAPQPISDYGKSKFQAEDLIKKWMLKDSCNQAVIIRPTVVIGKYNLANMYNLIKTVDSGKMKFYINGGKVVKSLASVYELCEFIMFLIQDLRVFNLKNNVLNFVSYPQLKTKDTIDIICEALNRPKPKFSLPMGVIVPLGNVLYVLNKLLGRNSEITSARIKKLDTQSLFEAKRKNELGFKSSQTSTEALKGMLHWYKGNS